MTSCQQINVVKFLIQNCCFPHDKILQQFLIYFYYNYIFCIFFSFTLMPNYLGSLILVLNFHLYNFYNILTCTNNSPYQFSYPIWLHLITFFLVSFPFLFFTFIFHFYNHFFASNSFLFITYSNNLNLLFSFFPLLKSHFDYLIPTYPLKHSYFLGTYSLLFSPLFGLTLKQWCPSLLSGKAVAQQIERAWVGINTLAWAINKIYWV